MFAEALREKLAAIVPLSDAQVQKLQAHYDLLLRWNKILNLTSVRDAAEIVERHYCESLFLASHLPAGAFSIVDIGSGAGFPGFPVAVFRPECLVTLAESHQRKSVFLREASRDLTNVRVVAKRAEEIAGEIEDRFEWAISRAVNYDDIGPTLRRLAPNIALLAGEAVSEKASGVDWLDPVKLPWGDRRVLLVSRETDRRNEQKK